ncbi:MAG TPA: succinylglutamate desuccinylase, partial [Candidatus Aminicenantes bacterium]|nr:succinylglutamate desuccinylase [Candidatus Aminicenantes bacterium]
MPRILIVKSILLLIIIALMSVAGVQLYKHRHFRMPVVAGPGVTKVEKLSDYTKGLKGTV